MDHKQAKTGTRVKFTENTIMAAKGDTGTIHELRGYNFENGKKASRYVFVWVTRTTPVIGNAPARITQSNCMATTSILEAI